MPLILDGEWKRTLPEQQTEFLRFTAHGGNRGAIEVWSTEHPVRKLTNLTPGSSYEVESRPGVGLEPLGLQFVGAGVVIISLART